MLNIVRKKRKKNPPKKYLRKKMYREKKCLIKPVISPTSPVWSSICRFNFTTCNSNTVGIRCLCPKISMLWIGIVLTPIRIPLSISDADLSACDRPDGLTEEPVWIEYVVHQMGWRIWSVPYCLWCPYIRSHHITAHHKRTQSHKDPFEQGPIKQGPIIKQPSH